MKKMIFPHYYLVIFFLILISCTSKKASVSDKNLVGDWYTVKGNVEALSFTKDSSGNYFLGTLHDRPLMNGTWKIENNKLVMTMDNGTATFYDYKIIADTLTLNGGEEIYTLTPPLYVRHPEVRILEALKSDLGLNFSQPRETDVSLPAGTSKGYSITLDSKQSSADIQTIIGYITETGFAADSLLITEICTGYQSDYDKDKIFLTICTSQDPEATDGMVYITVSTALKKITE